MPKESVTLEQEQWGQLLSILTSAPVPWTLSNPLIQAMVPQLQAQRETQGVQPNGYLDPQRSASGQATAQYPADAGFPIGPKST